MDAPQYIQFNNFYGVGFASKPETPTINGYTRISVFFIDKIEKMEYKETIT